MPAPFGEFVDEKHAVVGERNLARPRTGAAPGECDRTGGVVRCAEGAQAPARQVESATADGGDHRTFQGLGLARRRQQAGQA